MPVVFMFVTVTFPVTAAAGTFRVISVSVQAVTLAVSVESTLSPLENVTKLVDVLEEPKAVPVIVTVFEADVLEPDAGSGSIEAILGIS